MSSLGEIVEVGSEVRRRRVGDRVVVCSFVSCGRCWYCQHDLWSLCDNGNTNPAFLETAYGYAEYIRVPYADWGTFPVPDEVDDQTAVFACDAAPTGWMGADTAGINPGDIVAVWAVAGRHGGPQPGPRYLYDQVKQQLRIESDRPIGLREAIYSCRKGGTVFVLGVFGGLVDKFPMGRS